MAVAASFLGRDVASAGLFLNAGSAYFTQLHRLGKVVFFRNAREVSGWNSFLVRTRVRSFSNGSGNTGESIAVEDAIPNLYVWSDAKKRKICILGGGFGGLYTALRLESLVWPSGKKPQILLVDQSDRFIFKPLLYEILSKEVDPWEIAPPFSELLKDTSVYFMKDTVKAISPANVTSIAGDDAGGEVLLESGIRIQYDWLVLALGSESKLDIVPGALEHALPFLTLGNALEADKRLRHLERDHFAHPRRSLDVVVVGSGYSGVELAATLAERLEKKGKVHIVDVNEDICVNAAAGNREAAKKVLSARNVDLHLGFFVTSIGTTSLDEGNDSIGKPKPYVLALTPAGRGPRKRVPASIPLEADLVLWTVGTRPLIPLGDGIASIASIPLNGRGQVETYDTLQVKGHNRVFAIGDSAGVKDSKGRLLATTAQVALQQADYAGWNLWAAINNRPLLPFRYQHLGEMLTLGRTEGAISVGFIDNLTIDGLAGHTARKFVYLYRLPTDKHRVKVGLSWLVKSGIESISYVQNRLLDIAGFDQSRHMNQ